MEFKPCEWSDAELENYWSYEALRRDRYYSQRHGKNIALWLSRYLSSGAKLIDFGSGVGALSRHLFRCGYSVFSIERNLDSLEIVRGASSSKFFLGCSETLDDIPKNLMFNGILLIEVIEHLTETEVADLMPTISDRLTENGFLFITTPNREDLEKGHICCPTCRTYFHKWQHVTSWNEAKLHEVLEKTNLRIIENTVMDWDTLHLPWLARHLRWMSDKLAGSMQVPPDIRLVAKKK